MDDRSRLELLDGARRAAGTSERTWGCCKSGRGGGTLTRRQKKGNQRLSKRRIVAEHGIGKMKIWRIVADRFRNPRRTHMVILKNVAGLRNRMFVGEASRERPNS